MLESTERAAAFAASQNAYITRNSHRTGVQMKLVFSSARHSTQSGPARVLLSVSGRLLACALTGLLAFSATAQAQVPGLEDIPLEPAPLEPAAPAPAEITAPVSADRNVDGEYNIGAAPRRPLPLEEVRLFAEALEAIRTAYVREVDDRTLIEYAVRGMLAGLDPHSAYMSADDFDSLQESTEGEFGGLGIEVSEGNGYIKIIT